MSSPKGSSRRWRWWHDYWTAHRLRLLLRYGWCPACNSSPPDPTCGVCFGFGGYGRRLSVAARGAWADRYVNLRGAAKGRSAS